MTITKEALGTEVVPPSHGWNFTFFSRNDLIAYSFLLPFAIFFGIFTLGPFITGVGLSFTDHHILRPGTEFVGFENYVELVTDDPVFHRSVINTLYYTAILVPATVIIGLLLALYINSKLFGHTFSRIILFAPYVLSVSVTSLVWAWILDSQYGLLTLYLSKIPGVPSNIPWLSNIHLVMPSIALLSIWWQTGFSMILFLAGLQDIPNELIEASKIDGAGTFQTFWFVTLPLLRPVLTLTITLTLIVSMKVFGPMYIITQGGPAARSYSVVYYLFMQFRRLELGYASSVGILLLLMILLITLIRMILLRDQTTS